MTSNLSSLQNSQSVYRGSVPGNVSPELVGVLQKIVQNAGALLEVDSCSVAMFDNSGTTLVTLAALQKDGQKPRHSRFHLNEGVAGWVAERRESLIINDVALDPRFKRLGHTPIGSMMCVPLIDDDHFFGTLTASNPETEAFSTRQLQMLAIFADQAVLAITNARQAEQAQRQANQLEMLLDLSHGITTRLDADALYRTILTDIRRLVPCQSACIYRYDKTLRELIPTAELTTGLVVDQCDQEDCIGAVITRNIAREKIDLHDAHSIPAWAAEHRHPMMSAPVTGTSITSITGASASIAGTVIQQVEEAVHPALTPVSLAEMAAPFVSKNVLYGVLALQRPEPFTSEELRLVRNLSNMAAAALENVELFYLVRSDQEQLRTILALSADGIGLVSVNRRFIEVNPAFGRIFGLEPEQIVGMECAELFACQEEECPHECCLEVCMVRRALQQDQPLPYVEIDLPIKGVARSVGLSITPVSVTMEPLCLIVARDVTAIRDATRLKANFLSMITHELRSPLNAIHGYLDLALTGIAGELNDQQREFVQRARASSEHLFALVEDLLLVSRADSGQFRLSRNLANLSDIVTNAVEELELMATDSKIAVKVEIPDDFPPIYVDAVRMQQVIRNLVSNALRFTPAAGQ